MSLKLPPPEKVLEAWSAIGANRIKLLSPPQSFSGEAEVTSSDSSKTYKLSWDGSSYRSSDNATVWQGYAGYPVLALLMLKGLLPLPRDYTRMFASLNWNKLNRDARGNYAAAAREAFKILGLDQENINKIEGLVKETLDILSGMDITVSRWRKPGKTKSE